jgi:hypothetical protein
MGSALGRTIGRPGSSGQRWHGPGTMTPCPLAMVARAEQIENINKSRIIVIRSCIKVSN